MSSHNMPFEKFSLNEEQDIFAGLPSNIESIMELVANEALDAGLNAHVAVDHHDGLTNLVDQAHPSHDAHAHGMMRIAPQLAGESAMHVDINEEQARAATAVDHPVHPGLAVHDGGYHIPANNASPGDATVQNNKDAATKTSKAIERPPNGKIALLVFQADITQRTHLAEKEWRVIAETVGEGNWNGVRQHLASMKRSDKVKLRSGNPAEVRKTRGKRKRV